MAKNIHIKMLLSHFGSIFIFALAYQINFFTIPIFLIKLGVSNTELYYLDIFEILSYIISGFVLIQIINVISIKKISLVSLVIFLIALLNLIVVQDYNSMSLHLMIISGSTFLYLAISLIKSIDYIGINNKYLSVTMFFLFWGSGCLIGDSLLYFFKEYNPLDLIGFGGILIASISVVTIFSKEYKVTNNKEISLIKIPILIESIEIQIMSGFMITYIIISIYWNYENYANVKGFSILNIATAIDYMLGGLLMFTIPVLYLFNKYNKYILNLIFNITLLVSFLLLPVLSKHLITSILILAIIGAILYAVFMSNILILADKFEGSTLNLALSIYFTFCALGAYTGVICTDGIVDSFSTLGLLISIGSVTLIFLVYYTFQIIKRRLYQ